MNRDRTIPRADTGGASTFKLYSDGVQVSGTYEVISIMVNWGANMVGSAEIMIRDGDPAAEDFVISNGEEFAPGKRIRVDTGYDAEEDTVFEGIVVRHCVQSFMHKPSMLKIECKHDATKLTIGRNSKYYYDKLDSEIIEEIAGAKGLNTEVEGTTVQQAEVVQYYSTDWDFIVSRAESNGKLVYTENDKLIVKAPELTPGREPVLSLRYGGNIIDFEAEIDSRYQYPEVETLSWDSSQQAVVEITSQDPSRILHQDTDPDELAGVIGLDKLPLRHAGQIKDLELQAWADAQMLKSRLAKVRGSVSFEGYAQMNDGSKVLKPGELIELAGVGERFNGLAFVSSVRQEVTRNAWRTHVEFGFHQERFSERHDHIVDIKANGLLPAINGLQIGLVTKLEEDPDGEFRVQVRIPMIDPDEEGVWARIATLDAGDNRGSFFRPEIGDEVILGFLNDDPRDPIILGMVHSSAKASPIEPTDDNHEKGYVSREQVKWIINDEKKSIVVETPGGKILTMDDDAAIVQMEDENGNKILMDADGITIDTPGTLNLKAGGDINAEGVNINNTASVQFKAEGASGAELSSGGQAVLKGAMVMIN